MVFAATGADDVSRTYYDQPGHILNQYKIVSATRQARSPTTKFGVSTLSPPTSLPTA
jgi:hypothetical protein